MTWQERAACAEDGMRWAPLLTSDDPELALAAAAQVCPRCPVRTDCAAFGQREAAASATAGVYGGLYVRCDGGSPVWSDTPKRRGRALRAAS